MTRYFDTEGERIIEFFLMDEGLAHKKQVQINNLNGDYAGYRVADFYLPRYKVYIEFLGKWNDSEARQKYMVKKGIYEKNKVPCIYLYPDNLATLKYLFYMRLKDELKKYPELKFQLFKYRFSTCLQFLGYTWLGWLLITILVVLTSNMSQLNLVITPPISILLIACFLGAITLSLYTIKTIFFQKSGK